MKWILATDLAVGLGLAAYMMHALPAMNWLGGAWVVATWPVTVACTVLTGDPCAMPPEWLAEMMFTFEEGMP
ncbi:hypothetical protein DWF04_015575 [Cereibacter sphaeroides f. sp. denitrificans]